VLVLLLARSTIFVSEKKTCIQRSLAWSLHAVTSFARGYYRADLRVKKICLQKDILDAGDVLWNRVLREGADRLQVLLG